MFFNVKAILAVAAALALGVDAECYTSGQKGNQDFMRDYNRRTDICNQNFVGGYYGGQEKTACINQGSDNVRWNIRFGIANSSQGWSLSLDQCRNAIYAEANGCSMGGKNILNNYPDQFIYAIDPNTGRC